jgi:NAD+ synthase
MGFSYTIADLVLYHWLERNYTVPALKELVREHGEDEAVVEQILKRVERNAYKRKLPVIAKLSPVTIGREFRTPRDWGM